MCGVTGIFRRKEGGPNPKVLDAMTDRIEHRGPDGRGTYIHEGVGFGHRRLSIIGLSTGAQPMANADETTWVTYNGEIYNYQSLKRELIELGHEFRTRSDTEVIVHGYDAWGVSVVERLRGIFAFAIHDQKNKRVVCARDHLGVKPLYYHLTSNLFLFASEPKALLEHPEMPKRPNLDALHLFVRYGYVPAPYAAFDQMQQLEPGCRLIVTPDDARTEVYWRPPQLGQGTALHIDDELDRLVDETVGIELMSEVPLGAFLSGGIDSSVVAASMAHSSALDEKPRTFCIGFPEPDYDESGHSKAVAEHLSLDHTVDMVSMDDLDILGRLVETYDEPFGDSSAIPTYALCKMAKKYVTVALSGDGGDEVFAGYRRYQKLAGYEELPSVARKLASKAASAYPSMLRGKQKLELYGASMGEKYDIELSYFPPHIVPEVVTDDLVRNVDWSLARWYDQAPGHDPITKAQWVDLMTYLPHDILVKVDRASMAHALEVRVPLLDFEFVEWASRLGPEHTFGDGAGKVALKNHLARRVPREIFERPKMGFGVPLEYWLDGGLGSIAKKLRSRHPQNRFYSPIQPDAVERLAAAKTGADFSQKIWGLLFMESWWQKHF